MNAFLIGLQFLTRIRIFPQKEWKNETFGKSVSYFPLIGFVIGLFSCGLYALLHRALTPEMMALIITAGEFFITGAMHADGLMDTFDGVLSGRSRERSLEIMKDSRIGSFGLLAFLFLVLFKLFGLAGTEGSLYMILIAMPVIGRLNMTVSICEYPYARPAGIGKAFAVFRSPHAMGHAFFWAFLPALYFGWVYLFLMGAGLLTGLAVNRWIVGKIGGVTGDTYGAVTEITELVILLLYMVWSRVTVWPIS